MISKNLVVKAIIEKAENDFDDVEIKTSLVEGYEKPEKIIIKGKEENGYSPDVLLRSKKTTDLYEVELEDKNYKLDKWRLFSLYSNKQNGNFNIVAPENNLHHLKEVLKENQISAKIIYFT
ncbi:MAG: hypothetical protein U9N53_04045 [Bacteroidota bacterium]|nr:hypothetical protein [Bacteroidota bacterium]